MTDSDTIIGDIHMTTSMISKSVIGAWVQNERSGAQMPVVHVHQKGIGKLCFCHDCQLIYSSRQRDHDFYPLD